MNSKNILSKLIIDAMHEFRLKNYRNVISLLEKALDLDSNSIEAKELLAYAYGNMGNLEQAKLLLHEVSIDPNCSVSALYEFGSLLLSELDFDSAITNLEEANKRSPNTFDIVHDLATAYAQNGQLENALNSYKAAVRLNSNSAELFYNLGRLHDDLFKEEDANSFYYQALELDPSFSAAWVNLGVNFNYHGKYQEGLKCLQRACEIDSNIEFISGDIVHSELHLGMWNKYEDQVKKITQGVQNGRKDTHPFHLIGLTDNPQTLREAAQIYSNAKYPERSSKSVEKRKKNQKIKIGYFSADFWNHATTHLTAELFELHNKDEFEIYAFSFGHAREDQFRNRLRNAFDKFIDIAATSNNEVKDLVSEIGIDIAVDLSGHTQDARTNLFAQRLAPIQINYLVYPGTMGTQYHDYLLADRTLIPEDADIFYSEKIIYLPNSYQINDRKKLVSEKEFKRSDFNLPDDEFVFCCFNNGFKITPPVFDIWMQILHSVDNSVLWLLAKNIQFAENIKEQAIDRGIDGSRIIFAEPINMPDHLARQKLADLFLDTFPYGAHTTASDALWVGLPVITRAGRSFASRVGASLLNAIGLPELITQTEEEYTNLAVELAKNPLKLKKIREQLGLNRNSEPLFNTPLNVMHIESAYREAYSRYQSGLLPEQIFIGN